MGRQSSRIWLANNTDHKEMVTWNDTGFQYHDKAYIWNGSTFELVWEKIGLKLLYESDLTFKPVSSENNKYLYFTENDDESTVYRIVVNARNPEKEEHWTSEKYNFFSAPVSSRGFAIYAEQNQTGYAFDYRILNLENGTIHTTAHFDASEYLWNPTTFSPPEITNQALSAAESGGNHGYMSILSTYLASYIQTWGYVMFIAPTGISIMPLDNRTRFSNTLFDLGRLNDGGPRGLLPRFLSLSQNGQDDVAAVVEYGAGTQYGLYSVEFSETLPFSIPRYSGGGWSSSCIKVVRDGKLPLLSTDNHIWLVKANTDEFEFIDTEIESSSRYYMFDVSPDYQYAMTFEDWNTSTGTKYIKIVEIETGETIMDVTEEIGDMQTTEAYFVGHNCLFVTGYVDNTWNVKYRLYKWR